MHLLKESLKRLRVAGVPVFCGDSSAVLKPIELASQPGTEHNYYIVLL